MTELQSAHRAHIQLLVTLTANVGSREPFVTVTQTLSDGHTHTPRPRSTSATICQLTLDLAACRSSRQRGEELSHPRSRARCALSRLLSAVHSPMPSVTVTLPRGSAVRARGFHFGVLLAAQCSETATSTSARTLSWPQPPRPRPRPPTLASGYLPHKDRPESSLSRLGYLQLVLVLDGGRATPDVDTGPVVPMAIRGN